MTKSTPAQKAEWQARKSIQPRTYPSQSHTGRGPQATNFDNPRRLDVIFAKYANRQEQSL